MSFWLRSAHYWLDLVLIAADRNDFHAVGERLREFDTCVMEVLR